MSAELLRKAAVAMRQRATYAPVPPGPWEKEFTDVIRSDVPFGAPGYLIAETGSLSEAAHIASWHPAVALAVADWLDATADIHWPKRHDRPSESHYNAEPEHDYLDGDCDETCWTESYICNGCGTRECKPEISARALFVARAYLG